MIEIKVVKQLFHEVHMPFSHLILWFIFTTHTVTVLNMLHHKSCGTCQCSTFGTCTVPLVLLFVTLLWLFSTIKSPLFASQGVITKLIINVVPLSLTYYFEYPTSHSVYFNYADIYISLTDKGYFKYRRIVTILHCFRMFLVANAKLSI